MEETTGQLTAGGAAENATAPDPDKTLVQPRFDLGEMRTAQPVVPLAQPAARAGHLLRGGSLPLVLVLVSAVVGGLVSVLAYRAYQRPAAPPVAQEAEQQQQPQQQTATAAETPAEESPTPELVVIAAQAEEAQPAPPQPSDEDDANVAEAATPDAVKATREERAAVKEDRKPAAATERAAAARRADEDARPERETPRSRRVETITGATGERVSRRERPRDDSQIEGEATDYESPADRRARRRDARRAARRNVDRVRAIFEGDPPR